MYELPRELVTLYRHISTHVHRQTGVGTVSGIRESVLIDIITFATERMHIWYKYNAGLPRPYTDDPILNTYRFCNVYRELDRQTIAIHTLLNPLRDNFELWLLNLAFCRFICNVDTVRGVGLLSYDTAHNEEVYDRLCSLPRPKYGSAYLFPISLIQKGPYPDRERFFCLYLPSVMEQVAKRVRYLPHVSVRDALATIVPVFGYSFRFHLTEILIDVAYQFPAYIDLYGAFPIGPGSMPTMSMLAEGKMSPEEVCSMLVRYQDPMFPYLAVDGHPLLLSAENWEGIGCEYRKYIHLKAGAGRRRLYGR